MEKTVFQAASSKVVSKEAASASPGTGPITEVKAVNWPAVLEFAKLGISIVTLVVLIKKL
jgi:hypothetical protein